MYKGCENKRTADQLLEGHTCIVIGYGQSMTPILKSGQAVKVAPLTKDTILTKRDIVFCKVNGKYYLHLISAVKHGNRYQISNNHGHVNGTISRERIYGKVIERL